MVHPKYCLLAVDLFTSKIYTYPTKIKNLVAKTFEIFYQDIEPKRKQFAIDGRMRLQTNLEF